ncbi:hypothetical protein EF904_24135, partial [Streptomyces sp. WAC05950]
MPLRGASSPPRPSSVPRALPGPAPQSPARLGAVGAARACASSACEARGAGRCPGSCPAPGRFGARRRETKGGRPGGLWRR